MKKTTGRDIFGDAIFLPVVFVTGLLVYGLMQYSIAPDFLSALKVLDNDDAMRLVAVRDFLGGQGWYDTTQYRALPPTGVSLHWSRLVDAPIAGLNLLFSMFTSPDMAESLAAAAWPALLFIAFLLITGMTARAHFGNSAACFAMIAASVMPMITANYFPVGRVDHHNVQIVLMLSICALIIARRRPLLSGALAGALAALSLAVGLETLIFVALAGMILTLRFALGLPGALRRLLAFGLALGLTAPVLHVVQAGQARFFATVCDQLGPPVLSITTVAAAFVGAIALVDRYLSGPRQRLVILGVFALLALSAVAVMFQPCLGGPYADLPQAVRDIVVGSIFEAMPALLLITVAPGSTIGVLLPLYVLCAMTAGLIWVRMRSGGDREDMRSLSTIFAFLCLGVLASLWQIRTFTWGLAVVPLAFGITVAALANARWPGLSRLKPLVMPVLALILLIPQLVTLGASAAMGLVRDQPQSQESAIVASNVDCNSRSQMLALNALPKALIMAPLNLGPRILLYTSHDVTAVPYHRSAEALANGVLPFTGGFEELSDRAQRYAVDYVLVCDSQGYGGPQTAGERLVAGELPSWLEPVESTATAFTVLRVARAQNGELR